MISHFGSPTDPAVLLVAGIGSAMDWWEPEFCSALAAGGRYVIRYDHRDTGDAPSSPPGRPDYTGDDLVSDAAAVLDQLGVAAAHVVGLSMGGALAQLLALDHPDRVLSLTAVSTTAGAGDDDLPSPSSSLQLPPDPDWTDDEAVVEYLVASQRAMAAAPFDEAEVRAVARVAVSRTKNHESSQKNHVAAGGSGAWRHRLGEIRVPTLVIHGDEDPLFPCRTGRRWPGRSPARGWWSCRARATSSRAATGRW